MSTTSRPADETAIKYTNTGWMFHTVAAIAVLFVAASSVPTPLYVVYQQEWRFSTAIITIVFAVYVFFLLASLLIVGGLSDYVGRRPVLIASLIVQGGALILFLTARNVLMLVVARAVQGTATGAAVTALAATLVDLSSRRAGLANAVNPLIGLASGSLVSGLLVEYAPAPTHLVFAILLTAFAVAGVLVRLLPETAVRRPGAIASLQPSIGVPKNARMVVLRICPLLAASWALCGLYLSLGPSLLETLFALHSHILGGLIVTLLCGVGAISAATAFRILPERIVVSAGTMLAGGTLITLSGLASNIAIFAGMGTVVAGVGFGTAALACFGILGKIAAPEVRGELMAAAYIISYLAFSVPSVVAGVVATRISLQLVAEVYGIAVIVFSIIAIGAWQANYLRGLR